MTINKIIGYITSRQRDNPKHTYIGDIAMKTDTDFILGIIGTEKIYIANPTKTINPTHTTNHSADAKIFYSGQHNAKEELSFWIRRSGYKNLEVIPIPTRDDAFEEEVAKHLGQELDNLGGGIKGFSFENEDGEDLTFGWASYYLGYSYSDKDGINIANVYTHSIIMTAEEEANWIKNVLEQLQFVKENYFAPETDDQDSADLNAQYGDRG